MSKLIAIKVLKVAAIAAMYLFIRYMIGFEVAVIIGIAQIIIEIEYYSHE